MGKEFFAGIYMAAAAVLSVYLYRVVLKKDELGRCVAKVIGFGLLAVVSYFVYLCSNSYFLMSLSNSLVFASIDWILFFLVKTTLIFTKDWKFLWHGRVFGLLLILDNVHLLLNPFQEISMNYRRMETAGGNYLIFEPRILFQIHLGICYVMVAMIVIALVAKMRSVAHIYRARYGVFAGAFMTVILLNVVFLIMKGNIDFSILTYAVLGCFLYFVLYDYQGKSAANTAEAYFVEKMRNPIVIFDFQENLLKCNQEARKLFHVTDDMTLREFVQENPYLELHTGREEQKFETTCTYEDRAFYFQILYRYLKDGKGRDIGHIFVYDDITEKKRALIQNEYNANHDMLTGTYNRNYLSIMKEKIESQGLYPVFGAVYSLNGMRYINEKYGTTAGDKALCRMAWLLQQYSRVMDYVIRTDGGEMVLILPATTQKKANEIFKKIERRLKDFDVDAVSLSAECSYIYLEDVKEFDAVYEEARKELVQKKKRSAAKRFLIAKDRSKESS